MTSEFEKAARLMNETGLGEHLTESYSPAVQRPAIGDYVLATKYSDGDPGDPWALGFYAGPAPGYARSMGDHMLPRFLVNDADGQCIRSGGYRRIAPVRRDVGRWLLSVANELETSPPGVVNLWTMLTDAAFDLKRDTETQRSSHNAEAK